MILFLDVDGVLHTRYTYIQKRTGMPAAEPGCELFEHLPMLVEALRPYPYVQIILSTSWVEVFGFEYTKEMTGELSERVVGTTHKDDRIWRSERGLQVEIYAKDNGLNWVALDDDAGGWREWDRLILCPPSGLNQAKVAELVEKIERWEK
jgi:hypothetical protein